MNLSQLVDEEKLYLSRLEDIFDLSRTKYKNKFTPFLNERQIEIANEFIKQNYLDNFMFFGGQESATRQILGVFTPHDTPDAKKFPIVHITAKFPQIAELNHRDFLGSLMALQITRESIGDILIVPGQCDFFALESVSHTILEELKKVGSFGVKVAKGVPTDFVVLQRFDSVRGTIGSARVDALVSMLTNLSREKSSQLITEGKVQRNFCEVENGSRAFQVGDTFSLRGYGKFIVDEIGTPTKKGRLPVICRKYL